jgi:hypothetical protein
VVVVNRSFAQKYLGDHPWHAAGRMATATAKISIVEHEAGGIGGAPAVFPSYRQVPTRPPSIRCHPDGTIPRRARRTLRALVHAEEPSVALDSVMTMKIAC